ncbi:MAG: spore protease YyaC [Bacillota bacterium]
MTAINAVEKAAYKGKTRIHWEDPLAEAKLCWDLMDRLKRDGITGDHDKVLLCIGTDRSTGDCLGPLIGSKILSLSQDYLHVYGTLDEPIHASNLREKLAQIHGRFKNPYIIAVDACLGNMESVGHVSIGDGSLQPGAGVNKKLPEVGDIHITGIVNVGGFMEFLVLQNTRLNLVMKMADLISGGLSRLISEKAHLNAV